MHVHRSGGIGTQETGWWKSTYKDTDGVERQFYDFQIYSEKKNLGGDNFDAVTTVDVTGTSNMPGFGADNKTLPKFVWKVCERC